MKKTVSKRITSAFVAGMLMVSPIISAISASAGQTFRTSSNPGDDRKVGWSNGYHHEIWQADTPNSSTMTLHDNDGGFSTEWKCGPNGSRGNFLARRGLFWDLNNPKTYKDYNPFICDYNCKWSAGASGNSRICIYGWAQNPLVEYYIIEDWKNWSPAQDSTAQYKGQVTIDGSAYKIYTCARNSYTIEGNKNFTQYISIRQNLRTSGTIHVSEHFKAWESMGMKMGNLYEVAFNVEGWESDGSADVTMNMYEDDGSGGTGTGTETGTETGTGTSEPIEGTLYTGTFESGTDYWTGRGAASAVSSSSKAYEGSKSLYVSGRTSNWNGAELGLDSTYFKAGNAYSFSAMVNPTESTTVQLSMQYDQSGTTNYTQIAKETCTAGKWTKLENTNFTIPSGASNVKIYVEAPDSLCDIYVDRAICANKGYTAGGGSTTGTGSTSATVPSNIKVAYSSQYKQMQFTWDKVKGADKYGIAVYLAGKWRVQNSNISTNSYVTPKNLTPNMSYKVAIAARVNGKWDTAGALENYVTVTTRANNNIEYHTPSNTNNGGNNGGNNNEGNNGGNNTQPQPNGYYVDPSKPMVAISFDDGTAQGYSGQRIIDALYKNGFHATFFYVGNWIGKPDQVRDAYSKGMEIANHTTTHPDLTKKSASEIRSEYDNCASKLRSIIGAEPSKLMRLPYLASNWQVQQTLYDVPLITCSIDTQDYNGVSAYQIENTIKNAANNGSLNGAIVLCHETYDNTATAMENVLPWLKSQGYQVVTISEMFAAKGKTLNGGQIYQKVG
ncbi:MAG: glycoside hydrolase family 11 protein [Ruminococcus sp.]|uniref:glycoside hydrolase family 11 protein n=1 Tax=Ruminococcus sp. TaxID=41978 RepID=UPI0025F19506|nr:glycoside hydrolase family 11 protein [Ruminococcus sp.]MCR5542072.1 glycoside hydrolase family 11 protein [Ruminococcus sp.]